MIARKIYYRGFAIVTTASDIQGGRCWHFRVTDDRGQYAGEGWIGAKREDAIAAARAHVDSLFVAVDLPRDLWSNKN